MKLLLSSILLIGILPLYALDVKLSPIITKKHKATLISSTLDDSTKAIFYIHGFNDYVFNEEQIMHFNQAGYHFFGIDLHNYGRNLYENSKTPYYFNEVEEFFPEIELAIQQIKAQYNAIDITLIAHSQGGLIASLFVNSHPGIVDRLILNAPFFDFYDSGLLENFVIPTVAFMGNFFPNVTLPEPEGIANLYGQSIHKNHFGEWHFDTSIKRISNPSAPIYFGWIAAIYKAHKRLQNGLQISIPVLVMHSDQSTMTSDIDVNTKEGKKALFSSDIVVDVEDIKRYGKTLGNKVSFSQIEGGMHDLLLSTKIVRDKAYEEIFKFIEQ